MKATTHDNIFVGAIPGLDCKSEWLLEYGVRDFRGINEKVDLEITLIVKLDSEINKLFRELQDRAKGEWYGFLDGSIVPGGGDAIEEAIKSSIDSPGRYLLAYIPIDVLTEAVNSLKGNNVSAQSEGNGLVMTSSFRRTNPDEWPKPGQIAVAKEPESKTFVDKDTVFIGIIDDGIAVAHERFHNHDGTSRVRYFWDQCELNAENKKNSAEDRLPYGREYEGSTICTDPQRNDHDVSDGHDDDIHSPGGRKIGPDEDEFYRKFMSELSTPEKKDTRLLRPVTHGTHVLDLAAGGHKDHRRPIVAVQLPPDTVADTSGISFTEQYVMSGLLYILSRAKQYKIKDEHGRERFAPVVINFSFGTVAGPHDGTHQLERLFDEVVERQKNLDQRVRMVVPAGNSYQSRCHAEFDLTQDPNPELPWRLQPEDQSTSWLHVWLPPGDDLSTSDCPFDLEITPPTGEVLDKLTVFDKDENPENNVIEDTKVISLDGRRSVKLCEDDNENRVFGLATYTLTQSERRRGHLCISLRPTASLESLGAADLPLAPSGLWRIRLKLKEGRLSDNSQSPQTMHAWIERDDTAFGYRQYGRQSYFDHPDYELYDDHGRLIEHDLDNKSPVKRSGLINAIATGRNTITVGAARVDNDKPDGYHPSSYSAGGPLPHAFNDVGAGKATQDIIRSEDRKGVDLLAVSDDSIMRDGTLAAGVSSGSTATLNGTSVAAPQITRLVADHLAGRVFDDSLDTNYLDKLKIHLDKLSVLTPLRKPDAFAHSGQAVEDWESRVGLGVVDNRRNPSRSESVGSSSNEIT